MDILIVTTKNGRHRKDHEFPLDEHIANDPMLRASAISTAKAGLVDKVVNWRIEQKDR